MEIVRSTKLLRYFVKRKVVIPHEQTFTKITGLYSNEKFDCIYVDDVPERFIYGENIYFRKYIDGCFYPYVAFRKATDIELENYKHI